VDEVLSALRPEQHIFAGKVPPALHAQAAKLGLTIHDYLLREELAIANAVPTAEGAVQLAMEALPGTIHRSRVLVVGLGKVGQCVADRFRALGAQVTVAARKAGQLALAESMGCAPLPLCRLGQAEVGWDLVINTVPYPILGQKRLSGAGVPILMELASPPGGFDMEWVEASGLRHIPAPGLPGKVAPAAAARAIRTTLYAMLEELGV
jgi:dipicolinate synthase subunit A